VNLCGDEFSLSGEQLSLGFTNQHILLSLIFLVLPTINYNVYVTQ